MSKKAPIVFLALTLLLALLGLGVFALTDHPSREVATMPEAVVFIAADLHYIAPELTDHGAYYENMITRSDGKAMDYIEELTDAFLAEVVEAVPDGLILAGDLTFNGARASHQALADKLRAVAEAGGRTDPNLLDFAAWSRAFFRGSGRDSAPELYGPELGTFIADVNEAYFSGRMDTVDLGDPRFDTLLAEGGFLGLYLDSTRDDGPADMNHLVLY